MLRSIGVAAVVIIAVVLGVGFYRAERTATAYEQRAQAAEQYGRDQRVRADLAEDRARSLAEAAAEQDTVTIFLRADVARVDAENPPPADCAPNLAARDEVIASQARARVLADSAFAERGRALASLRSANDSLLNTLAARPKPSRWHGPSVSPAVFAGMCADGPCVGIGISINPFGRKL